MNLFPDMLNIKKLVTYGLGYDLTIDRNKDDDVLS